MRDPKGHQRKNVFDTQNEKTTNCCKFVSITTENINLVEHVLEEREKNKSFRCIQPCPLIYALRLRTW